MSLVLKFIIGLEELKTVFRLLLIYRDKVWIAFNMFLWNKMSKNE